MAETADELSAPLGQKAGDKKRRFRLPFTMLQAVAALLGLFLATFAGFAILNDNPLGGEPSVRVALPSTSPEAKTAAPLSAASEAAAKSEPKQAASGEQKTITIIDGSSGARQNVTVSDNPTANAGPDVPPPVSTGIDPRLLEKSRYGMIPVVANGLKPFTAYAANADRAKAATMPVVAIVVGGLGVGAAKTLDAIMELPPAVTLAFTPYGSDPSKLAERARAQRHEILLQVPMEPFDYPDNDPGPQTLLTTLAPEQNLDRLYWHLSRFQGYAGIANFMGSKFEVTDAAMRPIVQEMAKRGLGYFDDGTSPRSVAATLAAAQSMPFAKADISIDQVPTPTQIDQALASLADLAKERGTAIGVASALPVSIERISAWIKTLDSRGIMLVPLTTAMLKSKSN
ncbi:MAG TPA: divergent polysaccharide deacetylase family protein [Bradyrhizobium sp.]|nr:divergent polysaccharide deacetylase family protein [Bradyrhizobium sp.]